MDQDETDRSKEAGEQSAVRRTPSQRRSRERVERMLAAAVTLIERDGSDAMRMSDVAETAGVSIGSLYQYFPDKMAIVRSLAERCMIEGRSCVETELAKVQTCDELLQSWSSLVDSYYQMFLTRPVMRDIWCATQSDCRLRELELEDSRINARVLADVMARLKPDGERAQLEAVAFLIMQLCEATMRLAVSVDAAEGERLVETYKRMGISALRAALAR